MSANYDVIVIFLIYDQFFKFSLVSIFYLTKTENRNKNLQHSFHTVALSKGTTFDQMC